MLRPPPGRVRGVEGQRKVTEDPDRIAHVGDRLDNDIHPAKKAGVSAVFVQKGPWGEVHAGRLEVAIVEATFATQADLFPFAMKWR
jgi:FMN phosphatase YigB (HAD superfamily)